MIEDYVKARKLGEREIRHARSEGQDPYLAALDEILPEADSLPHIPVGLQEIPLRMIAGYQDHSQGECICQELYAGHAGTDGACRQMVQLI